MVMGMDMEDPSAIFRFNGKFASFKAKSTVICVQWPNSIFLFLALLLGKFILPQLFGCPKF
jgi:hypothetical protein